VKGRGLVLASVGSFTRSAGACFAGMVRRYGGVWNVSSQWMRVWPVSFRSIGIFKVPGSEAKLRLWSRLKAFHRTHTKTLRIAFTYLRQLVHFSCDRFCFIAGSRKTQQ